LALLIAACAPEAQATEGPILTEEPIATPPDEELTPAQRAAVEAFSENAGIPAEDIRVVATEAIEWPDSCVGIEGRPMECAQVVTPGFQITLEAHDKEVVYRTDEEGSLVGPATVALSWKREGGIAGFCDQMTVYLSGEVQVTSCKQERYTEGSLSALLSDAELAQLDEWLSTYGDIAIDNSDPRGAADAMTVMLTFTGTGSAQTLSQSDEQDLLNLAQQIHTRLLK
jgi:hypothetical protein